MTKIATGAFGGISPVTPPRYLQPGQAQVALNCANWNGPLVPLRGFLAEDPDYFGEDYVDSTYIEDLATSTLPGGAAQTIYLFGALSGSGRRWFQWNTDVDVVPGMIAGDTSERTFYTGDGAPKTTDDALNPGAGPYPEVSYDLGVAAPLTAPSCAIAGTADANAVPETRVYTYTFVNSWGDESAPFSEDPMPASAIIDVKSGESVNVTLPATAPVANITHIRIYRSVSGGGDVEYLYVGEVTIGTTLFNDNVEPDDLGNDGLPSMDWLPPPSTLTGLVGLPGGVLAGFVGRDIYLCEPYHPYAWPIAYVNTVKDKVVGLGVLDTTLVVLTEGRPVFIQGSHPDSMTIVEADVHQACVSKRSIVTLMGAVFYASPDGLMRISPSGSSLVTKSIMSKEQWKLLNPSSIHAYMHERRYVGFFDSPVYGKGGFVLDLDAGVFIMHDLYPDAGYYSLLDDALIVTVGDAIKRWEGGDSLSYKWRSKLHTYPYPVGFSALRIDTEGSGVLCRIYRDGEMVFSKQVTGRKLERLPSGKGKDWEYELEGTDQVFFYGMAEAAEELAGA